METYKLVLQEHLNHYGYLYGGQLLAWVDEVSYVAASLDYRGCKFVTVAMDKVEFKKSVRLGSILRFDVRLAREGTTSVQYTVEVYREEMGARSGEKVFTTGITFVCLDDQGAKKKLCPPCGAGS
jgi:acyl-CoA hydrolase